MLPKRGLSDISLILATTCALLLAEFFPSITVADTIELDGKTYPYTSDLSYQFNTDTPIQVGGSCHIFAAAALFEAACYRKTGAHVDISEGYLINRHLSTELSQSSGIDSSVLAPKERYP